MKDIALDPEQIQKICDQWADLLKIGSWKFTVSLCDTIVSPNPDTVNITSQFQYNCQNGTVVLQITYPEATERRIVAMLVDFSLIQNLIPRLLEGGDQYLDHDDRNLRCIVDALLALHR